MDSKWILPFADHVHFCKKILAKPLLETKHNRPEIICLHHTVSTDLKGTADFFEDPKVKVGIHFLIGPKGEIWQLAPMNTCQTHAGIPFISPVTKKKYDNINKHSIGIEVVNLGPLTKKNGKFFDYWKKEYKGPVRERYVPKFSEHKYWVPFTQAQEDAIWKLVPWLCNRWEIPVENVIGHYMGTRNKNDPIGGFACGLMEDVQKEILKLLVNS